MKTNLNEPILKQYNQIPKFWEPSPRPFNYDTKDPAVHYEEGWRDLIEPELTETQVKTGQIVYDEFTDIASFEVRELTQSELDARAENERLGLIAQAQETQRTAIETKLQVQVIEEAQAITDDTEALENQELFPIWETLEEGYIFLANRKYQALVDSEMLLYRVNEPGGSAKQNEWHPSTVPALFTRVAFPDEILPWVQPTGAQDAYNTGDKVTYTGNIWESTVDANVFAPGVVPGQWTDLGPI